jgi:dTDP-4-amino-4,6-dideoxygalactose transaminase
LKRALEDEPQVALLTYLFGVVPNLDVILPALKKSNVIVIEDFSQAFGGKFDGKSLGTLGDFGMCSTSSTKTLDTYGGAVVFSKSKLHEEKLRGIQLGLKSPKRSTLIKKILKNLVRNIATNKMVFNFITFPAIRFVNSRKKLQVGKFTGDRSLSPISGIPSKWFEAPAAFQARIGLRELALQDEKDSRRTEIANRYMYELRTVGPRGSLRGTSVYWQFISVEESPVLFRDFMNDMFVDCATTSLVKLSGLPEYGLIQNLSGTDAVYHSGVYLPCYHQLTFKEQSRVIQAVKLFHGSK